MSVIIDMAIFPTDKGESKSPYVARVVKMLKESGYPCELTPMGTVLETPTVEEATALVNKAYTLLEECNRVYATIKIDRRLGREDRMQQKRDAVERHLKESGAD